MSAERHFALGHYMLLRRVAENGHKRKSRLPSPGQLSVVAALIVLGYFAGGIGGVW